MSNTDFAIGIRLDIMYIYIYAMYISLYCRYAYSRMINKNMGVQPITNEHHGSEAGGTFLAINLPFDPFGDDICHPLMVIVFNHVGGILWHFVAIYGTLWHFMALGLPH